MTEYMDKAVSLANQIAAKASDALTDIACEMALKKWAPEFRAIMWEAIAAEATERAKEAKGGK